MSNQMTGHCLCGSVTYEMTAEPVAQALCFCRDCQMQGGTAFSVVVGIPRDSLKVEGDTLSSFNTTGDVHGSPTTRYFCSGCGSPIYSSVEATPDLVYVKA